MAEAFRQGTLGAMGCYRMNNVQADDGRWIDQAQRAEHVVRHGLGGDGLLVGPLVHGCLGIARIGAMGCNGVQWGVGFAGIEAAGGADKLAESADPVGALRPPDWLAAWLPAWRRAVA